MGQVFIVELWALMLCDAIQLILTANRSLE